jgi:hypothetical protein
MELHVYAVRPRKDKRGVDLISDALPFGQLWYGDTNAVTNAVDYAKHYSRSHDVVIRVYDEARQCDRDALEHRRFQSGSDCLLRASAGRGRNLLY